MNAEQPKALVTGAAGFIGSHVTDLLLEEGFEVIGLDNMSTGNYDNLPKENNSFSFIKGDIRDTAIFNLIKPCDYVFHLAALARIQPSIQDPLTSNFVNLNGTLNVLEYCRKHKAKLIFSSSSSIYKGEKLPINEDDEKDPKSPYALQKWLAEEYIQLYHKLYGIDFTILRYFNVYGERQIIEGAYAAVVGIFLNQLAAKTKLTLTNDGEQRRDFTYVKDVAKANLMATQWQGVFNVGTGRNYSINDIAEAVGGEKTYIGNRVGEAQVTLADNHKAREAGWSVTKDIMEWIAEQ